MYMYTKLQDSTLLILWVGGGGGGGVHNILLVSRSETTRLMECLVVSSCRFYDTVFACVRFVLHYVERVQSRVADCCIFQPESQH